MTISGSPSNTVGLKTLFNNIVAAHCLFYKKNIFLWSISSEAGKSIRLLQYGIKVKYFYETVTVFQATITLCNSFHMLTHMYNMVS